MSVIGSSGAAVELTGASKAFGRVRAVDGLDLRIEAGETVALLGANGAGKSTTVAMVLGLLRPDAGTVRVTDTDPEAAVAAGRVGAMLQEGRLPAYATVGELLTLATAVYPRSMPAADVAAAAGLESLSRRRTDTLSGGEQQRARFGFALAGDPDLLILDEPTAGLDVAARQAFWDGVHRRAAAGSTVLFATHYLAEAEEHADRVVILAGGRRVADGTAEAITHQAGRTNLTEAFLALTSEEGR